VSTLAPGRTLEAALDYRSRGWSVIPVIAGTKRPAVRWLGYQERAADETEIRDWFAHWPDAGVALVTGAVSGLLVIDIDPQHRGDDSLATWQREHGPLPPTVEAISGGGGRHLYFAHPGGELRNKVGLAPGIDLRGDGGYIVAPPSLHASGRRYAWRPSHAPDAIALAPLPDWLLRLLTADSAHPGHSIDHWRALVRRPVPPGERNNTVASLTGHLLWHGVDPEVAIELLLGWNRLRCDPPLTDDEVIRTVLSITRLHRRHTTDPP